MADTSKSAFSQLFGLPKSALYGHPLSALVYAASIHIGGRANAMYDAADPETAASLLADPELNELLELWRDIDYDRVLLAYGGSVLLDYFTENDTASMLDFLRAVPVLRTMGVPDYAFASFRYDGKALCEMVGIGRVLSSEPDIPLEYLLAAIPSTHFRGMASRPRRRSKVTSNQFARSNGA